MEKHCVICEGEGKYKCPTCLIFYCSVQCCRKHRENNCDVLLKEGEEQGPSGQQSTVRYPSEDTVLEEKLLLLKDDPVLLNLLANPHLRDLLLTIDGAEEPESMMHIAMQEPLFVEFADACLKVVEHQIQD